MSGELAVCGSSKLMKSIRALYSLIQFTTITLLYSFASSLGDFQVSVGRSCMPRTRPLININQFLYIDLFIIIPIAVTSKFVA